LVAAVAAAAANTAAAASAAATAVHAHAVMIAIVDVAGSGGQRMILGFVRTFAFRRGAVLAVGAAATQLQLGLHDLQLAQLLVSNVVVVVLRKTSGSRYLSRRRRHRHNAHPPRA